MTQQVSFVWTGCPGVYGKRTLTGEVLDQRARRDGGTDFLVKCAALPSSKWVNAEFCELVAAVPATVQNPELVAASNWALVDLGPIKLTRVQAGFYTFAINGVTYHIEQNLEPDSRWYEYWIIRNPADCYDYSDPIPTLSMCREALAEMRTARKQKAATAVA